MKKPRKRLFWVYVLGLCIGLGVWTLAAGPGRALGVLQIITTTTPGIYVKLDPAMAVTNKLEVRRTMGSDTRAAVYMVPK